MHWYQMMLAVGAVVALLLAWNVPRAGLWIGAGAVSFVASSVWSDMGLDYPPVFGAATNLAICFALYAKAKLRWEMRVWNCFHLMIIVDLLYLRGWIYSHYDYALALELANWLALLIISAAGIAQRVGYGPAGLFARRSNLGWAGVFHRRLYVERDLPPFWQANE